jgi:hypothetical protein
MQELVLNILLSTPKLMVSLLYQFLGFSVQNLEHRK